MVANAYALKLKIGAQNIASLKNSDADKRWICYRPSSGVNRLGVIEGFRSRIKIGLRWSELSAPTLAKQRADLLRQIKKLPRSSAAARSTRATLATLERLKRSHVAAEAACGRRLIPSTGQFLGRAQSLLPYRETLTAMEVDHVLKKIAYGGNAELRRIGLNEGLSALVEALVSGSRFASAALEAEDAAKYWENQSRADSDDYPGLRLWTTQAAVNGALYRMIYSPLPFKEWMTQLWAAHFAVNLDRVNFSYSTYSHLGIPAHIALMRNNAATDFRAMVLGMIDDSAMCEWLNNDDNAADSPNQNFAREFMELFTLGAVDPISLVPNYGEESVVAATAFMSGFYEESLALEGYGNQSRVVRYSPGDHDSAPRSVFPMIPAAAVTRGFEPAAFGNYVLDSHPAATRYIGAKLFAQIVNPEVSADVVASLATQLRADRFALTRTLTTLLKSEAMFSESARFSCARSPIDSFVTLTRSLSLPVLPRDRNGEELENLNWFLTNTASQIERAGQGIFQPPSVFGWKDACGVNRAGRIAQGDGWLADQAVLNRERGCIAIMNLVSGVLNLDLRRAWLPTESLTWSQVVDYLARSQQYVELTAVQRAALIEFSSTERDSDTGLARQLSFSKAGADHLRRKLPRLVCLLNGLSSSQTR